MEYSCSRSSDCCSTDHCNFVQCFLFSHIKQFCKTSSICEVDNVKTTIQRCHKATKQFGEARFLSKMKCSVHHMLHTL